ILEVVPFLDLRVGLLLLLLDVRLVLFRLLFVVLGRFLHFRLFPLWLLTLWLLTLWLFAFRFFALGLFVLRLLVLHFFVLGLRARRLAAWLLFGQHIQLWQRHVDGVVAVRLE